MTICALLRVPPLLAALLGVTSCTFLFDDPPGEGEGEGDPTSAGSYCRHLFADCASDGDEAACARDTQAEIDHAANQGDPRCTQVSEALLALLVCQTTAGCSAIAARSDCPAERAALAGLISGGAAPCLAGAAPINIPAAWLCPLSLFGDEDCDCGCGALDSDCSAGCAVPGCAANGCTFCYADELSAIEGEADGCEGEGE